MRILNVSGGDANYGVIGKVYSSLRQPEPAIDLPSDALFWILSRVAKPRTVRQI